MKFNGIVIHCSDSVFGNAQTIEEWHKERGFDDIGYHITILNGQIEPDKHIGFLDGQTEVGRDWDINGAHAKGYNDWFGICLIGVDTFTDKQFAALLTACRDIMQRYGIDAEHVIGHYECKGTTKTCPNFDVSEIRRLLTAGEEVWHG